MNNFAVILVDEGLLAELLALPKDSKLASSTLELKYPVNKFNGVPVYVSHPDLREVHDGQPVPVVNPVWRRDADGKLLFQGWGQEST